MPVRKTYKKQGNKVLAKKTRKVKPINGGGLVWDSNREKIIKRLLKIKAILPHQGTEILNYAKKGATKPKQINLFVEKSRSILLFNLFTIWKINGNKVKNTDFKELSTQMQMQYSDDTKWQSDTLHSISHIYNTYSESNKKTICELLDSGRDTEKSVAASGILDAIYLLNDKWIKSKSTIPNPKFEDLYRLWFNEKGKIYYDSMPWWWW
jgi:hypothetical protein